MGLHEINPLLDRIREVVIETHQLEGDGVDETAVAARRHELAQLKSLLANVVRHERTHDYSAAA